jgi:hypothetical protein
MDINFSDASKISCFNSCITGTTNSGDCPFVTVPDGGFVDTVYIEVSTGNDVPFDWAMVSEGFSEALPVFLLVFAAYCVIRLLFFVFK